jgi:threonine dehydratase
VLASLIKIKEQLKGQRVGLILSGGNIDLLKFKEWLK